jgi:hypothetical protein
MVIKEQCFNIAAADPAIAQVRQVESKDPALTKPSTSIPPQAGS